MTSAEQAASLIGDGETVAMSGFTGSGYPKAVPQALARRIGAAHARGEDFRINLLTGASTAPELDGALAQVDGLAMRMPFQSDPAARKQINAGKLDYLDIHLSHVAQFVWGGFLGKLDIAVVAFQRGLTDYLNVLNAQTLLFKQQQIQQQVQAARLSAHAELVTALGGGLGAGNDVPRDDRYVPDKPPAVMALFNH